MASFSTCDAGVSSVLNLARSALLTSLGGIWTLAAWFHAGASRTLCASGLGVRRGVGASPPLCWHPTVPSARVSPRAGWLAPRELGPQLRAHPGKKKPGPCNTWNTFMLKQIFSCFSETRSSLGTLFAGHPAFGGAGLGHPMSANTTRCS